MVLNYDDSISAAHSFSHMGTNSIGIRGAISGATKVAFLKSLFTCLVGESNLLKAFHDARKGIESEVGADAERYEVAMNSPGKWKEETVLPGYEKHAAIYAHDEVSSISSSISRSNRYSGIAHDLRPYQSELLQHALERNTIVSLPTGTGKSLIAFRLMEQMMKQDHLERPTLFLTQNVALMFQQARACEEQTDLEVGKYCGGEHLVAGHKLVDNDNLEGVWLEEISSKQACFFTGGLVENLMKRKVIDLKGFCLVVFDEAHHTKKSHVYNVRTHFCLPIVDFSLTSASFTMVCRSS